MLLLLLPEDRPTPPPGIDFIVDQDNDQLTDQAGTDDLTSNS